MAGAADSSATQADKYRTMIGHSNEGNIFVNGKLCRALLDTGSNVTTLAIGKYRELFSDLPIRPLEEISLDIEGAGGQKLPYEGFIEVDITTPQVNEPVACLMLIVPDTRFSQKVPVILGTNVLKVMMERIKDQHGDRFQQKADLPDSWSLTFRCMKMQVSQLERSRGRICLMKCATDRRIIVNSNSTVSIPSRSDELVQG